MIQIGLFCCWLAGFVVGLGCFCGCLLTVLCAMVVWFGFDFGLLCW